MQAFCNSPFGKTAFDSTKVKFRPQFAGETALFPVSTSRRGGFFNSLFYFATRPLEKTLSEQADTPDFVPFGAKPPFSLAEKGKERPPFGRRAGGSAQDRELRIFD